MREILYQGMISCYPLRYRSSSGIPTDEEFRDNNPIYRDNDDTRFRIFDSHFFEFRGAKPLVDAPPFPFTLTIYLKNQLQEDTMTNSKASSSAIKTPSIKKKMSKSKNEHGLSDAAIRRLARRGGVMRMSDLVYEETRKTLKSFLTDVILDASVYTEFGGRKTMTAMDVVYALRRKDITTHGF